MRKTIFITALLAALFIAVAMAGYEPAPVVEPDGVDFDPNDAASPVIAAYQVYVGDLLADRICKSFIAIILNTNTTGATSRTRQKLACIM